MQNRQQRRAVKALDERMKKNDAKLLAMAPGAWRAIDDVQEALNRVFSIQKLRNDTPNAVLGERISKVTKGWYNNHFSVLWCELDTSWGKVEHLWVRRNDRHAISSWHDMQNIKNELVENGRERTGVEVYPPADEVFDQSHWYHLWVLPLGFDLPFSL